LIKKKDDRPNYPLRVPIDLMNKMRYVSEVNRRSLNKEIESVLVEHVKNFEEKHGEIILTPKTETIAASKQGDRTENLPEHILKQIEDSKEAYRKEFRDKRD